MPVVEDFSNSSSREITPTRAITREEVKTIIREAEEDTTMVPETVRVVGVAVVASTKVEEVVEVTIRTGAVVYKAAGRNLNRVG